MKGTNLLVASATIFSPLNIINDAINEVNKATSIGATSNVPDIALVMVFD